MSSRRSRLSGRTCQRLGHVVFGLILVCRRCDRPCMHRRNEDGSTLWVARGHIGFKIRKSRRPGPRSFRWLYEKQVFRGASQKSMCHDCAFRPGSPERQDVFGAWVSVLEGISKHHPFYCHEGMPTDDDGRYVPKLDKHGHPIGAKLCGGWLREHKFYHQPGNGLVSKAALPKDGERPWS